MARTVKGYAHGAQRTYIPELEGNREDPEPIVVTIKQPTERQKRKFFRDCESKTRINTQGQTIEVDDSAEFSWAELACIRFVTKVENYLDASGEAIDTGEKLAELGESELILEVALEITDQLSLSEEKKRTSDDSQSSESATTHRSDGIAMSAEDPTSAALEVAPRGAQGSPGFSMSLEGDLSLSKDAPRHGQGSSPTSSQS